MVEAIVLFIMMIPFLIFAIVLSQGKGAFFITGYNTMSDSRKETYDETALAKFTGKIMYGYCFCILFWALNGFFQTNLLVMVGTIFFVGLTVFMVIYSNTGNRFKK